VRRSAAAAHQRLRGRWAPFLPPSVLSAAAAATAVAGCTRRGREMENVKRPRLRKCHLAGALT